jgi:hypothetical protein
MLIIVNYLAILEKQRHSVKKSSRNHCPTEGASKRIAIAAAAGNNIRRYIIYNEYFVTYSQYLSNLLRFKNGAPIDRSHFDALEQKLKTVEKQKLDLIAAFKKQMKLIDILKRQKVLKICYFKISRQSF